MTKRLKFKCWNCPQTYYQELDMHKKGANEQMVFVVSCPYCRAEAVVDLRSYSNRVRVVLRGENDTGPADVELKLPAVLPTRKS